MIFTITRNIRHFSQVRETIPKINLKEFLANKTHSKQCEDLGKILSQYGCIMVEDPRISQQKNTSFLAMMKKYFMRRQEQIDRGELVDVYKEFDYEIGLSPPNIIQLFDQSEKVKKFRGEHKPLTPYPPEPMRTMRYLWNIGEVTDEQIPQNRPPTDFPEFQGIMNDWGNSTLNTVVTISEMLQLAFGLKKGTFSQKLIGGPNKLAPLGFDLSRCRPGEAFAGIHDDFGFITVHGRSTFPGLFVWLPSGEKIKVRTPPGCLFLQAGSSLQHMTGGYIKSGMHEAINTEEVQSMAKKEIAQGKNPWRITSTVFTHLRANVILKPQGRFETAQSIAKYPPIRQYDDMMKHLKQRQVK